MKGQAIFKIFYYKTQHRAHQQFPPNTVKYTLLDIVPSRTDFSKNLRKTAAGSGMETASPRDAAGCCADAQQEHSPSREVKTQSGLWATQSWSPSLGRDEVQWR